MRQFSFFCVLLVILLCGTVRSDTLKLPRPVGDTIPGSLHDHDTRYHIITVRQEDGKLLGERMEHLANVWDLLFEEFTQREQATVSPHIKIEPAKIRHRVILYRSQREYIDNLRHIEPDIARTNGLYLAPRKTAYFFSTEAKILFHEGTHQILAERFFHEKSPTFRNNFWAVEGIALFMETLKIEDKHYKVGDILANRLYSAMVYRFEQNHHLPIRQLTAMGAAEIQLSEDLQPIYSQSATLVHWLMFAEAGRYRGALFELLRRTYCNEATPETLSELTGLSYEELDAKYVEFLKTIPPAK